MKFGTVTMTKDTHQISKNRISAADSLKLQTSRWNMSLNKDNIEKPNLEDIQQGTSGPRESAAGNTYLSLRIHPKSEFWNSPSPQK